MYGYTSHIPRQQELCDWLNSIPNSWNRTYSYYHYNSNYTPSSADKLLQVNSSGSAEFTPTGVVYSNTEASKFIKEEDISVYRLSVASNYYDYGTVSNLNLTLNKGSYYDEDVDTYFAIDKLTMNTNESTISDVSEFTKESGDWVSFTQTSSGVKVHSSCEGRCFDEDHSAVIKHIPTNSRFTINWKCRKVTRTAWIDVLFTSRTQKTLQYVSGWYKNGTDWEQFGTPYNNVGNSSCINQTICKSQQKFYYVFGIQVDYSPCDDWMQVCGHTQVSGVFADTNGSVLYDIGMHGYANWWYYTCYQEDVPNNNSWWIKEVYNNNNDVYAMSFTTPSLNSASRRNSMDDSSNYVIILDIDDGFNTLNPDFMTDTAFNYYYPNNSY